MRWFLLFILAGLLPMNWSYLYDPNEEEIQRALDFQRPKKSWGYQARQERQVRLLCFGGSNTYHGVYTNALSKYLTNSSAHSDWTGTLEWMAERGASPRTYLGNTFPFESRPAHTWPNIILMDFSMNTFGQVSMDKIAETIDAVIRTISYKYAHSNRAAPDYMFLELLYVRQCMMFMEARRNATVEEKVAFLNHNSTFKHETNPLGDFRGCPTCKEIRSVADFYDYPTVSWRVLAYSAFQRYFLAESLNTTYDKNPWKYTHDGLHINFNGGDYLADKLFQPFFSDVMQPRKEEPVNEKLDIHMFAPAVRPLQLVSYVTWDQSHNIRIQSIIRQPSEWKTFHNAKEIAGMHHGNECSGTNQHNETLTVDFSVPMVCNDVGDCKVSVGFLHSWNASWIGDLSCDLIQVKGNKMLVQGLYINTTINEEGKTMGHTGSIQTQFDAIVYGGNHTLHCRKLDSRFTCIVTLSAMGTVVV